MDSRYEYDTCTVRFSNPARLKRHIDTLGTIFLSNW